MNRIKILISYVLLIVFVAWSILPIAWVILSSFKTNVEIFAIPPIIFSRITFINYIAAFSGQFSAFPLLLNSVIVSVGAILIALPVGLFSAYTFARSSLRFRGSNTLFFVFLLGRMIPPVALAIPLFLFMRSLGLLDTLIGLILTYAAFQLPFVIWMMRSFLTDISETFEEAAMVDGCSRLSAFLRIVLPLAAPGLATTTIFTWTLSWNEFIFAVFLTSSLSQTMPIHVGAVVSSAQYREFAGRMCASSVAFVVPVIILSFLIQKHIVRGFTAGALKG